LSQALPELTPDEVKAFRKALGLTQIGFAQIFPVSRQTVEVWESKGAPGVTRWMFAAVNAGLIPWGMDPATHLDGMIDCDVGGKIVRRRIKDFEIDDDGEVRTVPETLDGETIEWSLSKERPFIVPPLRQS
jgi:hypothetical protein